MREFFLTIPAHFLKSFSGRRVWLHVLAIALTYGILMSGLDWWWYAHAGTSAYLPYFWPAVIIGGLVPLLLPLGLLAYGHARRSKKIIMTGWGLGQAALLGSVISSLYKAFTGRIPPPHTTLTDVSHGFQFGFLRHGIFWGWPSSHTTIAFAVSVAFCMMYRKNRAACALALIYALYIGLGVSMSIHWLSEAVAGALIGTAVGLAVGRYFHQYTNR